jgi:uncharacterized protein YbbK (DUF523 family)
MTPLITIGVSACLLGEPVRYDGSHKHDTYITETLRLYFTFVPVCPEVGCGLPAPREAMRLEGDPAAPRLMTIRTRIDITGQMLAFCPEKIRELEKKELCGFIFKERSPSCGLTAIPLHGSGTSEMSAVGLFAHEIFRCFPLIPLEEAERLHDPCIRKNFIERVIHYHRTMNVPKNEFCIDPRPRKAEQ